MPAATVVRPPTPPELEGYMDRLKANPSIFGSWVRRYFRVNPKRKTLEYFKTDPQDKEVTPNASVLLSDIYSVADFGELQFQIKTSDTAFMLQAGSKAELSCWVTQLSEYIEQLREFELAQEAARDGLERAISKVN